MTYVPAEHWQNTGYIFLLKYIRIFSMNSLHPKISKVYTTEVHSNTFLSLVTWRWIIFTIVNFPLYQNLENTKQLMKHFSIISLRLSYGCSARHSPGKNRRVWGASHIPQPCSEHYIFVSVSVGSWIVILNICSLLLQVSMRVHRTHNSAIYKYT